MPAFNHYEEFLGLGDFSDIYLEDSTTLALRWEGGQVESITRSEDSGAGLRYFNGNETRFAHADLGNPMAGSVTNDERSNLLGLKKKLSGGLTAVSFSKSAAVDWKKHKILKSPTDLSLEQKIKFLERAFKAAQTGGANVRQINVNYGEKIKKIGYVNSSGEAFAEERIYMVFSVTVTVERAGDLQTGYESMGGLLGLEVFDGDRIEQLAKMVSLRAHQKLDAPQAPVGEMPVVIAASAGGTLIHEAVGHSLEADAVIEGTSPSYVGKVGQVVANPKLTVFDNPTVPNVRGSFYFDDEGVKPSAAPLIENGILKDYMFDRFWARRANRSSNGHGRRESYAHRPIPRMSNTYIAPGLDDPQKIISSFQNGLLVTKMGGGQVNTANGDYVFEVEEGYQVENGRKKMVRGATLLGNGPETLHLIDQVGSDHGWGIGTCGKEGQGVPVSDAIPTIHIKKLVVGGQ